MWDRLGSPARCSARFLMDPQVQKKKSECHSYYHRQLQAARCINQGNGEVPVSEGAVGWELVAKTGCETRFEVLWDRESSPTKQCFIPTKSTKS